MTRGVCIALCLAAIATVGAAQGWVSVAPQPESRYFAAMAYDAARGRTVLFGGTQVADTWEYDGRWRQVTTPAAPAARSGHVMAYDAARNRTVLFGGTNAAFFNDTWEYDGTTWYLVLTPSSPPVRQDAAFAYDSSRGRTVLFGGTNAALLNDTWEYDGTNWTRNLTSWTAPSPREETAMAFDPVRGRCVLFGGRDVLNWFNDTWEYDGSNWTRSPTAISPPGRSGHLLVFDAARARTVLTAGFSQAGQTVAFSDTWEFDGSIWNAVTTANTAPANYGGAAVFDAARARTVALTEGVTREYDGIDWQRSHPAGRQGHRMAYDTARQRTVLFGGVPVLFPNGSLGDTWEFDGSTWRQPVLAIAPPARFDHAMVYDSHRRVVVLFGGGSGPINFADTWTFDGVAWRQHAASGPLARRGHAMAYDSARSRTVLFGGAVGFTNLGDTWEFDGVAWLPMSPAASPPARQQHALAYDSRLCTTVLFGGLNGTVLLDTWRYDGVNWQRVVTATSPVANAGPAMVFDPVRARTVLTGGSVAASSRLEVYEFDGGQWSLAGSVPDRCNHAMVYDSARGCIVLYGGLSNSSIFTFLARQDTLELPLPAQAAWNRFGSGCPGSAGLPVLDRVGAALPQLGTAFPLSLSGLPAQPGAAWLALGLGMATIAGTPLPLDLAFAGAPGCQLWITPEPGVAFLLLHAGGSTTHQIAIPAVASLSGLRLTAQALVFDASAPGGIGSVTNAGVGVVR